ncbi:allantoicase [Micromonospora sp. CPCC 206060]|uniref:allantoicase n=1 Tax=Micromonospora sp. CPCC 206060 TaxID=3122406 RepID=UPI002FEFE7C7
MNADNLVDLASRAMGGSVVYANDESFADRENLINPGPARFNPRDFGAKGQVYDGWETRRRRESGSDHAIVRLGAPGLVHTVLVDTAHFTGNYPPQAAVDGCCVDGYPSPAELATAQWFPLVDRSDLTGDAVHTFPVGEPNRQARVTHLRLTIFPDGGVARLRAHGVPLFDPDLLPAVFDLAAAEYGGRVVDCSDRFYGSPGNLLLPGLAVNMGDGWETRRRRDDGNDWVLVELAGAGGVHLLELDTTHFKGNAPGWAEVTDGNGRTLLPRTRLQPDTRHRFRVTDPGPVDRLRLDIHPDGGMARLRAYGSLTAPARDAVAHRWQRATTLARDLR